MADKPTADVIQLPTAASEPIVKHRQRGKYPKVVAPPSVIATRRGQREYEAARPQTSWPLPEPRPLTPQEAMRDSLMMMTLALSALVKGMEDQGWVADDMVQAGLKAVVARLCPD